MSAGGFALDGRTFAAVLFDLDGTLIDSTPAVDRSWAAWAREFGMEGNPVLGRHGLPAADKVQAMAEGGALGSDVVAAASARIAELELGDTQDIVTLPGARAALAALPGRRAAIVTSCSRPLADARLRAAGLIAPPILVTADELDFGKPHPEGYRTAATRAGYDPHRCLVVEDAPSGLEAGRAAGCVTLAVTTTTPVEQLMADAVVGTLADVRFSIDDHGVRIVRAS